MIFSELLWGLGVSHSGGDPEVSGLDYNSRRVQPGWVFVAMHGESSDGNRYIDTALKHGAAAVVVSNHGGRQLDGVSASIDALPAIKRAVGERATVMLDSGVRSGLDVVRALALCSSSERPWP